MFARYGPWRGFVINGDRIDSLEPDGDSGFEVERGRVDAWTTLSDFELSVSLPLSVQGGTI